MTEAPIKHELYVESEHGEISHYLPVGAPVHIIHELGVVTEIEVRGIRYLASSVELEQALGRCS